MKRISANKRMEQWKLLLHQTNHSPPAPAVTTQIQQRQEEEQGDTDPFDCSELIIPDTKGLVRSSLEKHLREWQELDSRIIVEDIVPSAKGFKPGYQNRRKRLNSGSDSEQDKEDSDDNGNDNDNDDDNDDDDDNDNDTNDNDDNDDGETSVVIVTAPAAGDYGGVQWGFHANRIRLPDFFDYTSKGPPPSQPDQQEGHHQPTRRRQVISLQDPTQRLDYESELWKIFNKVPLEAEIETCAAEGAICTNMLALHKEIEEGNKEYTRLDGHSLSRLRKKDRHYWPRTRKRSRMGEQMLARTETETETKMDCATIKIEFWKQQVKRFGPDPNKCEMEFLSTQTLQDVHNAIVELSEDDLFQKGLGLGTRTTSDNTATGSGDSTGTATATATGTGTGTGTGTATGTSTNTGSGTTTPTATPTATPNSSTPAPTSSSGYFFIEDTFYSTGDVDCVTPVMTWLNNNNQNPNTRKPKFPKSRKKYLKINPLVHHKQM
jgi:hypothetical protein